MSVTISDDPALLDLDVIHGFLSQESTWAQGIAREKVAKSIAHSLCFGAYEDGAQVGFARVVTDKATFAWLADVFIDPDRQGLGLGKGLMDAIVAHPDLQGLRRFMLATADAHGLYERYGFKTIENPERLMAIIRTDLYPRP